MLAVDLVVVAAGRRHCDGGRCTARAGRPCWDRRAHWRWSRRRTAGGARSGWRGEPAASVAVAVRSPASEASAFHVEGAADASGPEEPGPRRAHRLGRAAEACVPFAARRRRPLSRRTPGSSPIRDLGGDSTVELRDAPELGLMQGRSPMTSASRRRMGRQRWHRAGRDCSRLLRS